MQKCYSHSSKDSKGTIRVAPSPNSSGLLWMV